MYVWNEPSSGRISLMRQIASAHKDQDNDFRDGKRVSISIHPLLPTCLQSNNGQYMGPELTCH